MFQLILVLQRTSNVELQNKLLDLARIYTDALDGVKEKYKEDRAILDKEYDECSKEPDPEPDPNLDNPVIMKYLIMRVEYVGNFIR